MLEQVVTFFTSFFANPSALGIGLAVYFGAIWLTPYYPPLFKKPFLWVVMVVSAFLALVAVAFVQIPLQLVISGVRNSSWVGFCFSGYRRYSSAV